MVEQFKTSDNSSLNNTRGEQDWRGNLFASDSLDIVRANKRAESGENRVTEANVGQFLHVDDTPSSGEQATAENHSSAGKKPSTTDSSLTTDSSKVQDSSDRSESSPEAQVQDKERELSERYGITFAQPGEARTMSFGSERPSVEIVAGRPTLPQLQTLEAVLKDNPQMNVRGVKIWYATNDLPAGGQYSRQGSDKNLTLFPSLNDKPLEGPASQRQVIAHELAHHEQQEEWGHDGKGSSALTPEKEELMKRMGWKPTSDGINNGAVIQDRNGTYWKGVDEPMSDDWEPHHESGERDSRRVSSEELREKAAVRPPSGYFYYFDEVHAEAASLYRTSREDFARESPDMYQAIKDYDQTLLDRRFGRSSNGTPNFIRDLSGKIVPYTSIDANEIAAKEREWRVR